MSIEISIPVAATRSSKRYYDPTRAVIFSVVFGLSLLIVTLPLLIFWLSFREGRLVDSGMAYSLANYVAVFSDAFTYRVLSNTLWFSLTTLCVSLAFGLPAAWLVERTDLPGKSVVYGLMTAGLLLPGFATAMGWLFLIHPRIGVINGLLRDLFGFATPLFNVTSIMGMGWVEGLSLAPVAFIMTASVFRSADPALEDCAQMCGASSLTIARRITLPLAWPGILAAGIYIFTIGFAAFDVPAIIGWSSRIFTFSTYMLMQLAPNDGLPQYGPVAALGTFVILLAGILSLWYGHMQAHAHRYQVITGKGYRRRPIAIGRYKIAAWLLLAAYFTLSKLAPLLILIWSSLLPFFQAPSVRALESISLKNYRALPWELVWEGLRNSTLLVLLTPTITLVCAMCFSWTVLRSKLRGRAIFDFVAFLPHAVPNIVFGVGALLFALYVARGVVPIFGTVSVLLLVFIVARLSYATRMTNGVLIQVHRDLEEAAEMSGAATGHIIWRVLTPIMTQTLVYAWLWIALITFKELTLAVLLTTRDNLSLPIVVWNLWVASGFGQASALTLLLLILMTPLICIYWWAAPRLQPSS